jgi:hypothetical protein
VRRPAARWFRTSELDRAYGAGCESYPCCHRRFRGAKNQTKIIAGLERCSFCRAVKVTKGNPLIVKIVLIA